MYYVTNQNNQIIAIDPSLLALLKLQNIDELYREMALGNATFSLSSEDETVTIATVQNEDTYHIEKHDLSSLLGDMTLIQIESPSKESVHIDDDVSMFTSEKEELVENFLKLEIAPEENISLLDDDLMFLKDTDDSPENEEVKENTDTEAEKDHALLDLILPNTPEIAIDEIDATGKEEKEEERIEAVDDKQSPLVIDIENISQSIGISTKDYTVFLNEYIDTALSFEKDLQSTQEESRAYAIKTLSHLSNILHLPFMTETVTQIENALAVDQDKEIKSFYAKLARLTTSPLEIDNKRDIEILSKAEAVTEITDGFGSINLDDVKYIHFDFQPEEAAKDLSLPVELIEEFVHDFIAQAHVETKKMMDAYQKGDLETIQKISHLLKGTSSNLRIGPLSDTLYEIQRCEESSKLEALIKNYWGHFLFLETQTRLKSK